MSIKKERKPFRSRNFRFFLAFANRFWEGWIEGLEQSSSHPINRINTVLFKIFGLNLD